MCLKVPSSIPLPGEPKHFYGFKAETHTRHHPVGLGPKASDLEKFGFSCHLYPSSKSISFTPHSLPANPHLHAGAPFPSLWPSPHLGFGRADLDDWEVDSHVLQDTDVPIQGPEGMNMGNFGNPLSSGVAGGLVHLRLQAGSDPAARIMSHLPAQISSHSSMLRHSASSGLSPSPHRPPPRLGIKLSSVVSTVSSSFLRVRGVHMCLYTHRCVAHPPCCVQSPLT